MTTPTSAAEVRAMLAAKREMLAHPDTAAPGPVGDEQEGRE